MPSSRRRFLAAAGAAALAGVAGCSQPDTPTTTGGTTSTTTGPPHSADAARFEASQVRELTDEHPPRLAATLTNVGDEAFTLVCGFAPPFAVTTMEASAGDAELFCYPVGEDARRHVRGVDTNQTDTSTTPLPPDGRVDGCWRVVGSFATNAIAYTPTLAPDESASVAYDVYTYGSDACFPDGDYRASTEVSVSAGTTTGERTASWTYGVTLALRDGSVSAVTARDVREVARTDG
ncbi:twin-arginine translocation signal domain-containing protein [Halarchaeum sp. P4]|uniref:twin-arginine translocation signal domain-containing protein n=1 Tax=Halarchaeum sp. P4 TaxID=3421639 RepID=UPI003EBB25A7